MMQQSLFEPHWERFPLRDASVRLQRGFLRPPAASELMDELLAGTEWRHDAIVIAGRSVPLPRLHQWYGHMTYDWSGIRMPSRPMPSAIVALRAAVEAATGASFNGVLLNCYRTGSDSVGWHADDEAGIVGDVIASVSLGAERDFCLRRNDSGDKLTIALDSGSLLVMSGETQKKWQHSLPKRREAGPRINLTFRQMREGPRR